MSNKLVLLDAIISEQQAQRSEKLEDSVAFELFSSEQVLKDRDLSEEELLDGLAGGGQDGGIDSVYSFLGNTLLAEDHEIFTDNDYIASVPRQMSLQIIFIQSKRSTTFIESALTTAKATLEELLDLQKTESQLRANYNDKLVDKVMLYRNTLLKLASKHPKTKVKFVYASRGDSTNIGKEVKARITPFVTALEQYSDKASVDFYGADELWNAANLIPTYTLQLPYDENITFGTSYAALVSIGDYLKFITDDNGDLRRYVFEMNVRDYQGGVEVNKRIAETLKDEKSPEFWWLNNGVTIVCSHATIIGKLFNLDDVQIVNGLQTSFTLYETLAKNKKGFNEEMLKRHILVRVLVTTDQAVRDQVIRATNSQTSVPIASLRATDDLQREIEKYLLQYDWFYDRRKNYYKNIGKKRDRIIGIPYMAQSVIAAGLSEPDQARARPSSLLKNNNEYNSIFDKKLDFSIYLYCVELQKKVDNYLISIAARPDERSNLRFHMTTLVAWRSVGSIVHNPSQLAPLAANNAIVDNKILTKAYEDLLSWRAEFSNNTGISSNDQVSKNSKFVEHMKYKFVN